MEESRDFLPVINKIVDMKRYLDDLVVTDLERKTVLLTGPRQVGKTTLCRHLMQRFPPAQYLAWKPGGKAAIRWPAATFHFDCIPYPCANGASSKAARHSTHWND